MKKLLLVIIVIVIIQPLQAQFLKGLKDKVKEASKQKAEEKVIEKITTKEGKTFDKVDSLKLPSKKKKENTENSEVKTDAAPNGGSNTQQNNLSAGSIKLYSKYDFIPGEKILGYDDFATTAVGDFPVNWTTNGSGEIMTIDNHEGKWLNISKEGYYLPQFIKSLPENFTVEYDLLFLPPNKSQGPNTAVVALQLITMPNVKTAFEYNTDRAFFELDPYMNAVNIAGYTKTGEKLLENSMQVKDLSRKKILSYHIAVWRQNSRLRVYLNDNKIVDAPSLLSATTKYNALRFQTSLNNDGSNWLISNFKYATGLPDTRNQLLKAGKFSTTGILFDINSAVIKPASYGTLKDIANTIKGAGDIKIKIVGHTDNDGSAPANLDLSKRRAQAVKDMLVNEFGIAENILQTDGKGATQPAVPNSSSEAKAQNRRVEFIKTK